MNTAERFGFTNAISRSPTTPGIGHGNAIAVPASPSVSATKMATDLGRERQHDKNEPRGQVTPAAIRASMPPIRDIEFEYLKKFQTDLFRVIVKAKSEGLFHAEFTVTSRDIDEYTLDFIFTKLVAVLRHQKFFVALGSNLPRSFAVSWDPILCKDSITPEEMSDPNSIASIRTRRFARLQRKHETLAHDERETNKQFQEYMRIMNESGPATGAPQSAAYGLQQQPYGQQQQPYGQQQQQQQQRQRQQPLQQERYLPPYGLQQTTQQPLPQQRALHALEIDEKAKAKAMLMQDMLNMSRFQTTAAETHPLETVQPATEDAMNMIRAANQVAGDEEDAHAAKKEKANDVNVDADVLLLQEDFGQKE